MTAATTEEEKKESQTSANPPVAPMDAKELERKKFGEDIAFGVQQTAACWATDFIDPVVGEKIQHRLGDAAKMPAGSTWIGEFAGDTAAFFTFLGVQKYAPGITHTLHKISRKLFDGFFERSAKGRLKQWAEDNDVAVDSPEYKAKMEGWKDFQADNIAKSSIISSASITLNVGTQRIIGNRNTLVVIAVAKIAGALITVASMLGLRFVLPKTTQTMDDELARRYFSPLIRKTQKLFGAEVSEKPTEHHAENHAASKTDSYMDRVSAENTNQMADSYGR